MPVCEAMERMPPAEFKWWMAMYQLEGWGEQRADLRAGIVASTIANVHTTKGKRFSPKDFMPDFEPRRPKVQSAQEQYRILRAFTVQHNEMVKRNGQTDGR